MAESISDKSLERKIMNTQDKIINNLGVQLANKSIECANYKAYFEEAQEQHNALLSVLESDKDLMDLFNEIKNKNEGTE